MGKLLATASAVLNIVTSGAPIAATTYPALPRSWQAAIGSVKSESGRSTTPEVASGANRAGQEGPMQFETEPFAAYATARPGGALPPSPFEAVHTASRTPRSWCGSRP